MFWKKVRNIFRNIFFNLFFKFLSISRNPLGQVWRWRWRWQWRWRATLGSETHRDYSQHILGPRKNLKRAVMSTICSLTHPLPGGTQNLGQAEKHFFDTFFSILAMKGPQMWQKSLITWKYDGKTPLEKKIGAVSFTGGWDMTF